MHLPLATAPERERAGGKIRRRGPQFVRQVMDFGNDEVVRRMLVDVPRGIRRSQMPARARFPEVRRLFGQSDSDC